MIQVLGVHSSLANSLIFADGTNGFNSSYSQALALDKELGASRGIDAALKQHNLDALVLPVVVLSTTPSGIYYT